ncbi:hypothetical protein NC653_014988 [Populus alba x Populus x berolinensis]|uniref:Uncharacterized protein n=1 Tax=Populus alba x Populus x berolinensis TaxID=444605 RepID=A0AAD6W4M0_9ROSI|nr:hypothetical protein NC653_014988 [Populus alba x Populus x berolinensis]
MDFSPPFTVLEGGYNKDNNNSSTNVSENQNAENLDSLKQSTNGKPPRHLRQSMDSTRLLNAADLALDVGVVVVR